MEKIQNFINSAKAYLGAAEADNSHREIIDSYNSISPLPRGYKMTYSDPWCAAFVSAVGKKAGIAEILPECSCDAMIALYKRKGQYFGPEHKAQTGDLIFYDWDKSGTADHVGIVTEVTGSVLKLIEGNVSDKVSYRVLTNSSSYIKGYASPFDASSVSTVGAGALDGPLVNLTLPQLCTGSRGNSVKAMQHILIGSGYSCGSHGADGDFGTDTKNALCAYQRAKGLSVDGIAGKQSWSTLLL
ncbi:MAG: peptidoglycan-binding protein [Oscillospiraceae bacterium]|nr:peptidoglycan-binding protein [Oscillospiraceae bacterium]